MRKRVSLAMILVLATGLYCAVCAAQDRYGDSLPEGAIQRLGTLRMRYTWTDGFQYLPDDRAAIVVPTRNRVDVWDLTQGEMLATHEIGQSRIMSLQVRSDGNALLVANTDGQVIEWSLPDQQVLQQIETAQENLSLAVYSPDESRVLSAGARPPTYKHWELATGRLLVEMAEDRPEATAWAAVYCSDGNSVFVSSGRYGDFVLSRYDLASGEEAAELLKSATIEDLALSADGRHLLAATRYGAFEFEVASGQIVRRFAGHPGYRAFSVSYGPEPGQILTGAGDGSIRLWDREATEVITVWRPHTARVSGIRVSEDRQRVLSFGGGLLMESVVATGESRLPWARHLSAVQAVAFAPDGQRVVTGSADGSAWLWEAATGEGLQSLPGADTGVYAMSVSPDGARAAAGDRDGTVREWHLHNGRLRRQIPGHRGYVHAITYSPDGERLASSADDASILVRYGERTDAIWPTVRTIRGHRGGVLALAFSEDSSRLLTGGRDRTIRLWDPTAGFGAMHLQTLREHRDWVQAVAFAGGADRAVSADRRGIILHWDLQAGQVTGSMDHGASVNALVCSPDGSRLYSAGRDGRIVCWDLNSGEQIAVLTGHNSPINALALSPDGTLLVSGANDTTALLWRTPAQ